NRELLDATRALAREACEVEADLLVHLAEIDERKLYLDAAFPSLFAFCVGELAFSEDAAYSRILVARAARRLPVVIDALRSRRDLRTGARPAHRTGEEGALRVRLQPAHAGRDETVRIPPRPRLDPARALQTRRRPVRVRRRERPPLSGDRLPRARPRRRLRPHPQPCHRRDAPALPRSQPARR